MQLDICNNPTQWDAFVEGHPAAYNYHRWCWRQVIEDTFGHTAYYLAASEVGVVKGVLPLFSIRSRLFGCSLVSMPFFSYGGMLADSVEAQEALSNRATELALELHAQHVQLRQGDRVEVGWHDTIPKIAMGLSLPNSTDGLWKMLSSRLRNKVRNAQKSRFTIRVGGLEDIAYFYRMFTLNMRRLGTPVYSKRLFENICRTPGTKAIILTVWNDAEPIAGALLTRFREAVEMPWCASMSEWRKQYLQDFLYWSILEWAMHNGIKRVDFGRCTPGSGNYLFKQHWGCEERPLHWYFWLRPGTSSVPQVTPENPKYRLAIEGWKRLPLAVANTLGPRISRGLP